MGIGRLRRGKTCCTVTANLPSAMSWESRVRRVELASQRIGVTVIVSGTSLGAPATAATFARGQAAEVRLDVSGPDAVEHVRDPPEPPSVVLVPVVQDLSGPEAPHEAQVGGPAGGDHLQAQRDGNLHAQMPDPT